MGTCGRAAAGQDGVRFKRIPTSGSTLDQLSVGPEKAEGGAADISMPYFEDVDAGEVLAGPVVLPRSIVMIGRRARS
jgi:hypothetical protein